MSIYPGFSHVLPSADAVLLTFTVNEDKTYTLGRYYAPRHPIYYQGTSKEIAKAIFLKFLKKEDTFPLTVQMYPKVELLLKNNEWIANVKSFNEEAFQQMSQEVIEHLESMKILIPFS